VGKGDCKDFIKHEEREKEEDGYLERDMKKLTVNGGIMTKLVFLIRSHITADRLENVRGNRIISLILIYQGQTVH